VKLSPIYGEHPVLHVDSIVSDVATPLLRQRDRLGDLLSELSNDQWASASRCDGWTVQDVVSHLVTVNQFWALSITSGAAGTPTRYLVDFDPVATPKQLVSSVRSLTPDETLHNYKESNAALRAAVEQLTPASWELMAEAPPGHLAIHVLALHALWDAWVHERDIAFPLGREMVEEADEIIASLAYVAGLGAALRDADAPIRRGALEIRATDPDTCIVIDIDSAILVSPGPAQGAAVTVTGDAIELLEAFSIRAPFTVSMDAQDRWLLGNLGQVFQPTV
jgi:uncharacterized protein (TIGR03083 family)